MMAVVMPVLATFCVLVLYGGQVGGGDVFTSMEDLKRVLHAENQIALNLRRYVAAEGNRLEEILKIADDYEDHSEKALWDSDKYLSNPLNAFLLVKRFTSEWEDGVVSLIKSNGADAFLFNVSQTLTNFPDLNDLRGAANALIRIQDTYALTPDVIARGELKGVKGSPELTAADCMELGKQVYFQQDYYHAIPWFHQALDVLEKETEKTANKALLLDFLAYSTYIQGNVLQALNLTVEWLKIEPASQRALANQKNYLEMLTKDSMIQHKLKNEPKFDAWKSSKDFKLYEQLCRGENTHRYRYAHKLKCHLRRHHPIFYIRPLKEEVFYLRPKIVIYHNLITDAEINKVKELASPRLRRSTVVDLQAKQGYSAKEFRVSQSAWIRDREDPLIARLSAKLSAMSNLTLDTAEELQVLNYGIGGHYEPHFDFARGHERVFDDIIGNRVATGICYMSDVQAGGATVFPRLGVKLWPSKGACALWYNLKRNGEGDMDTHHAGCPVLAGTKWVCNKWFHERGQEFNRPCLLQHKL